jgi:hypothetical protein
MDKKSLAAVIVDKRRMELREFAVPIPSVNDAVLRVEACGICGSDYHYYKELDHWPYLNPPHIMGHEVVGRIGAIGREASAHWKLKEGDLVAVEAPVTCQRCRYCLTGNATLCADKRSYGISASMADPPHLWGGYAQYMYLHPNSILHPVPAGVTPQAAVLGWASVGVDPARMGLGPVPAVRKLLAKHALTLEQVDVIELNEAFASQVIACDRELKMDPERLNVNGGGIALGHPTGCSGARILVGLVHELARTKGRLGLATLCVSGGQGMAVLVERV